ncbi:MAG: rod shape-determining protein [Thermoanaerobaculia bacterium]
MRLLDLFRPPLIAIDVGTATTRVCFGAADVVEHPSVVHEQVGGALVARPVMRGGVVADVVGVAAVVRTLLDSRRRTFRRRPSAVVCAPTDVSEFERDALVEAVVMGGASVAMVVPEPLAAAVGAGVDIACEYATAVIDIGEGVTDLAVFRDGAMIVSQATRIGCCADNIEAIASFVAQTVHNLPDDLAAEVIESGVRVTGGGAKLHPLVRRIEERVGFRVDCADEPLSAVIRGASAIRC